MRIRIVTPAPPGSRKGNRITALRWSRILRALGHAVVVEQEYRTGKCDLMIALHAVRSFESIHRFHDAHPARPLVVAITGTDIYQTDGLTADAQRALTWADRIICLQNRTVLDLPADLRDSARVIYQSATAPRAKPSSDRCPFDVCVMGHLRPVKDPFRAAEAVRLLPPGS